MSKRHEKSMIDLQRLMKAANLQTEEDLKRFVTEMTGKTIPEFEPEAYTVEEQAQDLVYQAEKEENPIEADRLVYAALQLDPDCVEAFEYLGDLAGGPLHSLMLFRQGLVAAQRKLGEKFFNENKGYFWGLHQTRPYMRCLKNCAECLYVLDQKEAALAIYLELLDLNPNDNQGIRNWAGLYCLELGKLEKFLELHKQYEEDASAFHHFNFALYCFMKQGDSAESRAALMKAREVNKHVLQVLLSKKAIPDLSEYYSLGSKEEAHMYGIFSKSIWHETPGAIVWLEKVYLKK